MEILLATASPRRVELMSLTGWTPAVEPRDVDESGRPGEGPVEITRRLALEKARSANPATGLTLGADTVVVDAGNVLGKPSNLDDARWMLRSLRGRTHQVVTSIALIDHSSETVLVDTCVSAVPIRNYTKEELEDYLETGSPIDKAGSYGIQDGGFEPVSLLEMRDCFANVMGLPLCHVVRNMRTLGHEPDVDVPSACQEFTGYSCPVYEKILESEPDSSWESVG